MVRSEREWGERRGFGHGPVQEVVEQTGERRRRRRREGLDMVIYNKWWNKQVWDWVGKVGEGVGCKEGVWTLSSSRSGGTNR